MTSAAVASAPGRTGRWYLLAFGCFLAGLAVPGFCRTSAGWESVYLVAAQGLRAGTDIFAWGNGYVYPPFGALLAVPFTFLPAWLAKAAWVALNLASAFVLVRGAWRLSGARLPGEAGTGWRDHVVVWLGAAAAGGLVVDVMTNRQTDLMVAALMVYGAELLLRGRSLTAGGLFGLAAALESAPLLWAPYLAWKRRWLASAAVAATFLFVNWLPDALYPTAEPRLAQWGRRMVAPIAAENFDPGMWASAITFNHSLSGVLNRWLTTDQVVMGREVLSLPRTERMTSTELKRWVYGAGLGLTLLGLAAMRRRGRTPIGSAAEFGMVLTLLLLLSPMSSKPHFCTLLVPQWLLARLAWRRGDRLLMAATAATAVAGLLANKDLVGWWAYGMLLWYGSVFGACLTLFLGCAYARRRYAGEAAAEAARPLARAA